MGEEGGVGEDRTQNSLMARFFKVNQNWLNLTPVQKHTLWYKHTTAFGSQLG